jgi:hypothetical protein
MFLIRTIAAVICIGAPGFISAQTPVDPDVAAVLIIGYWNSDHLEGFSRVIVRTGGFDHVASSIRVEWIARRGRTTEQSVVAVDSTLAVPDRMYSLGNPELYSNFDGENFRICGTHVYDSSKRCWRFWVGPPGRITLVEQS